MIESENRITEARKKSGEAVKAQAQEIQQTMHAATAALSDLFEAAASDSETYEKFKKAMAIVDATISLATTIAAATAASTAGDPYTMVIRIAANVAAVTAQFAALIASLKRATVPSAPTFERGGIVPGTSYTGDKVIARVNSREMILTQQQQANLFDLIRAGVPQAGIDYSMLQAVFTEAVKSLPPTELVYSEFKRFERNVSISNYKSKR